jgi:hypothetical protein
MLANSGQGFSAFSSPLLSALDEYNDFAPALRVCLKKLSKKDGLTRAKALEELLEFLQDPGNSGCVQALLPTWVSDD